MNALGAFGSLLMLPVLPRRDVEATVKNVRSSVFQACPCDCFVCVTDGAADSGELDLSGIDDGEIELVRTRVHAEAATRV